MADHVADYEAGPDRPDDTVRPGTLIIRRHSSSGQHGGAARGGRCGGAADGGGAGVRGRCAGFPDRRRRVSLIGIALHLLAILIVAAGLLICVTSGWYVVSRAGLRRIIALCVAVLALAGTIAGLFFADINWLLLLIIAVLAALSVLAARYALRRTERALRSQSVQAKRVHQAEHPVLIMNPKSGGGKAERFKLAAGVPPPGDPAGPPHPR